MTELWFRNPRPYARQLKNVVTSPKVMWDIAYLLHWDINPFMYMNLEFGFTDWRYMVAYPIERYVSLFNKNGEESSRFPMWDAEDDEPELLIEYLEGAPDGGKVAITGLDFRYYHEKAFEVSQLAKSYPDVNMHLFNSYSFRGLFGMNFKSGDYQPRDNASRGGITLPSGKKVEAERISDAKLWIESLGFTVEQLKSRDERIKFNIVSASWAAEHFNKLPSFKKNVRYIPISSSVGKEVLSTATPLIKTGISVQDADKKACDFCSLWNQCRYYREGSVCTVPGSDYIKIAEALGTRDSLAIANGISELLKLNVERIQDAREVEKARSDKLLAGTEESEEEEVRPGRVKIKPTSPVDPELTKLIDSTIKHSVSLANLYKKPDGDNNGKVVVVVGSSDTGSPVNLTASPAVTRELASRAVAELEASGISREDISEAHIEHWLAENIIEGETA